MHDTEALQATDKPGEICKQGELKHVEKILVPPWFRALCQTNPQAKNVTQWTCPHAERPKDDYPTRIFVRVLGVHIRVRLGELEIQLGVRVKVMRKGMRYTMLVVFPTAEIIGIHPYVVFHVESVVTNAMKRLQCEACKHREKHTRQSKHRREAQKMHDDRKAA
mmetsp:Transcript_15125/g.23894  ORF Transcript_15125/g.23894 Transcript_15125/m.23894 type:complete len:164 (-) Transcript_15125:509-1000(-)